MREIEDRLKSIRNIEKITNTMKIVASTKLTRATRAMNDSRTYGESSNEVFKAAETAVPESEEKKTLIIVCSSDKGLCGGIHSGMSRFIRRLAAKPEQGPFDLVIVGEKCRAQLQRTNAQSIQLSFAGVGKDIPTFTDAQAIADQIVMLPTEYSDVKILYNRFINASSYEPTFIEAFSEEAITQSGKMLRVFTARSRVQRLTFDQPTSTLSRLRTTPSLTSASTPSPTPFTGLLPRATLASSPLVATPWT